MNQLSIPRAASSRYMFRRLIIPLICISIAFYVAWISRAPKELEPIAVTHFEEAASPAKILDQISLIHVEDTIQKPLESIILTLRKSSDRFENWITMGDLVAQIQRNTGEERYYYNAELIYREALRLKPDSVEALTGMAWVTGGRHEFLKSIEWANQAITIDIDCAIAYGILGDASLELGNYDAALDHYQRMMDIKPDLSSWSRGAHLLWIMGDKSKAQWLMNKAIHAGAPFAENTAWCKARLATMLFQDGAILAAQDTIQSLMDSGSKNRHILSIAAKIATAKKEFSKATDYYQQILSLGSNQEALTGIGDLLVLQGLPDQAETYYQKVEDMHQKQVSSGSHDHHFMAKFFADHDRSLIEALRMSEEHKLTKNVYEADTLAWVYYKNGHITKAIEAIKQALRHNTPDAEIHYHAGLIASAYGDLTSAQKHLDKALQMNPNFNPLQITTLHKTLQDLENKKSLTHIKTRDQEDHK